MIDEAQNFENLHDDEQLLRIEAGAPGLKLSDWVYRSLSSHYTV